MSRTSAVRHAALGLTVALVLATATAVVVTMVEWRANPGGPFRGTAAGTQWHFLRDTAWSWFAPTFATGAAVLAPAMAAWGWRRARFYPGLGVLGAVGLQSFELGSLFTTPASLLYGVTADLTVPLLNRRAIDAAYRSANARQRQALYEYQRTLLGAYTEVSTQLARIRNIDSSYAAKKRQVQALGDAVADANLLFRSARLDYLEVLLTQREALESRIELVELRQQQLDARVTAFRALGGGVTPPSAGD